MVELHCILSNFAGYKLLPVNTIFRIIHTQKRKPAFLLILVFMVFSPIGYSQFQPTPVKRSNNQITISGKNYFLHEVLKGQTLYGISKAYDVSEEELKTLNTDLFKKSIFPGMVLRIPDIVTVESPIKGNGTIKCITHTVQPKETLFSISKEYGIKVEEIRELNPELKWGLKTGTSIKIPRDKITITQTTPAVEAKPAEVKTNDAVQEMIKENPDQPCKTKPFPHESDNFRLAILLPLLISQNDTVAYSDTLAQEHFRFYEFLEGIYLAIDSLRLEGLNMTVEVFDTERNADTIRNFINNNRLKGVDLIIGPVFPNEIEVVAEFARSKHIPMVSPLSTYDVVNGNPYAFQIRNKLPKQIELATTYLGSKYKQNVLVIGRLPEKSNPSFTRFLDNLDTQLKDQDPLKKASFKTIYFTEATRSFINSDSVKIDIDSYLSSSGSNFIILPSEEEVFTTELINQLNLKTVTHKIHVFGLNQWVFKELDLSNLYNLNLELYCDFEEEPFIDFSDPLVLNFCRKYKQNWNIEPSRYSFQGFDIAFYFSRALFQFGRNLTGNVSCWNQYLIHPGMLTRMKFQTNGTNNGFDNHAITVLRYEKDQLVRKKVN